MEVAYARHHVAQRGHRGCLTALVVSAWATGASAATTIEYKGTTEKDKNIYFESPPNRIPVRLCRLTVRVAIHL